jgi:hypothetical protein
MGLTGEPAVFVGGFGYRARCKIVDGELKDATEFSVIVQVQITG